MKFVISSGHGLYVRGASGIIDEVDEARRVVECVAEFLRKTDEVTTFHDDVSKSQNENLERIVDFHNSCNRDLDISIHLNAYEETSQPMGTEVLYVTQEPLAELVSASIAQAGGFIDRGGKQCDDLYFLNNTTAPSILIEVCFVDSSADVQCYDAHFERICRAIAEAVSGQAKQAPSFFLPPAFSDKMVSTICWMAQQAPISRYIWAERGEAPIGYTQGMAIAFATCYRNLLVGSSAAHEMAKASAGNDDDALAWFADELGNIELYPTKGGAEALRALFVVMHGLGMRESSGRHCEGVDQSASNHESDTAECSLFQTSWNINTCSDEIEKIFTSYSDALEDDLPQCYLAVFQQGVACTESEWESYGDGYGRAFQDLSKTCPSMHIEITAVGLRNRKDHWGPVIRREVEILKEADDLYRAVQTLIDAVDGNNLAMGRAAQS